MNKESKYPRLIPNYPRGLDLYLGKSQQKTAESLAQHIRKETKKTLEKNSEYRLPHIIGLEGEWGSGKSNLVRILRENNLKESHHFFEYDAWGHQEDLQRRSFLETLTHQLIDDNVLIGNTTIELVNGDKESVSWKKKLDHFLARKFETETERYPKIGYGIIIAYTTTLALFVSNALVNFVSFGRWGDITLRFLPIAIALVIWGYKACKNKKYRTLDFLLAVYQDKVTRNIEYKTVSQREPSVTQFKQWMKDVSDALKEENQKDLVIVFDNMDRLPANKVKELWSSINTFFAEVSYDNIWVIITFDRNHLANAFGKAESSNDAMEARRLTTHFINKTFPVIYRVATPVLSDLKAVFNHYFEDAFGRNLIPENEKELISRIFRILQPKATIRDIISFINEIVAQHYAWVDEISLLHISVFTLTKKEIFKPIRSIPENILTGEYYKGIEKIIDDRRALDESISALAFNIKKSIASL